METGRGIVADAVVIGAGAFGLWSALALARRGARVMVVEAGDGPGAGASATPVGALTPFPRAETGDPLAALQAAGLMAWPAMAAALEAETGMAPGYAVCGRLVALADPAARGRAEADLPALRARLPLAPGGAPARWAVEAMPSLAGLLAPDAVAAGGMVETVSARVNAPRYLEALAGALAGALGRAGGRLLPRWPVAAIRPDGAGWAVEGPAGRIATAAVVAASGWDAAALLGRLAGNGDGRGASPEVAAAGLDRPGRAVRGQAARLRLGAGRGHPPLPDAMPLIQAPGLYVVHHGGGRVGVGATREPGASGAGTDGRLDTLIARAVALVPALAGAEVEARWSGVRPRPPGRLPQVGPLPGRPGLWLASGGHGIGLALAHVVGPALAGAIAGDTGPPPPGLPALAPRPAPR